MKVEINEEELKEFMNKAQAFDEIMKHNIGACHYVLSHGSECPYVKPIVDILKTHGLYKGV